MLAPPVRTCLALLLAGASLLSAAASAQTAAPAPAAPQADNQLDEIVVTATRREETLQEVPVAVSAYSAETLDNLSVRTVGDIANTTPNLSRTSGPTGGNDAFFFIRGIGQLDSNPANDPGVGVYIDGVYMGRLQGASIDALDLARVEVLRGPQGTLFGRNTIGGAINMTSIDPSDSFGVEGRLTTGSRGRIDAFGAIDLPVGETLGARFSIGTRNQGGFGRNFYTGADDYGEIHTLNARGKIVFEPSDTLKFQLSADYNRGRNGTPQTLLIAFNPRGGPIPGFTPLGVAYPTDLFSDTSGDIDQNFLSVDSKNDTDNYGVSLTGEWDFGAATLKTILAWRHVEQEANNDFDGTGYRLYDNIFDTKSDQYSAEVQLFGDIGGSAVDYLVGFYAYKENIDHANRICLGTNLGQLFGPQGPQRNQGGCIRNNQEFSLDITNFAGFGQVTWNVTDQIALVGGLRYTWEKKEQAFGFFLNNGTGVRSLFGIPPLAFIPTLNPANPNVGVPTEYEESWDEITPKAGINFKPSDDLLVYFSYSRGFKSGGFNGRPTPRPDGRFNPIEAYDPETLTAYELGFKSELFDRKLRLNAALYRSIYDGIQLLVLDPASGFFNNANAGKNRIQGFEVELAARPARNADVYVNVGFTDTEYKELNPLAGIPEGAELPVTPKWTVGIGGSYTFNLGDLGTLTPRADWNYRGDVFYGAPNGRFEFQEGFGLLNLRVTYTDPSERFTLAAFGLNVLDKRYFSNAQDVTGALGVAFAQIGPPAEWGLEFGFRF